MEQLNNILMELREELNTKLYRLTELNNQIIRDSKNVQNKIDSYLSGTKDHINLNSLGEMQSVATEYNVVCGQISTIQLIMKAVEKEYEKIGSYVTEDIDIYNK